MKPYASAARGVRVAVLVAAASGAVAAQTPWVDASASWNVQIPVVPPCGQAPPPDPNASCNLMGKGCAVEDFNGDGRLDIVTGDTSAGGQMRLLLGQPGGGFVHVLNPGLGATNYLKGLAAGDYDADGDLDLLVCRRLGGVALYANDGTGQFSDVTAAAGVTQPPVNGESFGCAWADFDGDGILDFVVARRFMIPSGNPPVPAPNAIYRGIGPGSFVFVPGAAGAAGSGLSFLADASDLDDDGDQDLLVCDDFGGLYPFSGLGQVLWRNDGGVFTDQTAAWNVTTPISAMGCAWGDVDRDGDFDYFLTNDPRGHVLGINNLATGGGFPDQAALWGVVAFQIGWGCAFFDYDADGFVDLYVAQNLADSVLYRNNGGVPPMVDVAPSLGLNYAELGEPPDCVAADFDDDGDLDLYETGAAGGGRLMLNPGLNGAHWLKVKLVGTRSNRDGIGARVKVMAGGAPRLDAIRGRAGYLSSGPLVTYHGLGTATAADQVDVRWPSGAWTTRPGPIAANQTVTIVEPKATTPAVWNLGSIKTVRLDALGDVGTIGVILLSLTPAPSPVGDGRLFPFTFDALTQITMAGGNAVIANNVAVIGPSASLTAYVGIPALPALAGLVVYAAGGTTELAAPLGIRAMSARVAATIQ